MKGACRKPKPWRTTPALLKGASCTSFARCSKKKASASKVVPIELLGKTNERTAAIATRGQTDVRRKNAGDAAAGILRPARNHRGRWLSLLRSPALRLDGWRALCAQHARARPF